MLCYHPFAIYYRRKVFYQALGLEKARNGYWFLINKFPPWEIRTSRFLQGRGKQTITCGQLFFYSPLPLKATVAKSNRAGWYKRGGSLYLKWESLMSLKRNFKQAEGEERRVEEYWPHVYWVVDTQGRRERLLKSIKPDGETCTCADACPLKWDTVVKYHFSISLWCLLIERGKFHVTLKSMSWEMSWQMRISQETINSCGVIVCLIYQSSER